MISPAVGMTMEDLAANLAGFGVMEGDTILLSSEFFQAPLTKAQQTSLEQAGCEVAVLPDQQLPDPSLQ
jgi:hypothetical protein